MSNSGGKVVRKKVPKNGKSALVGEILEYSPPQTELDMNVRNVLTHLVKHLKTITFDLGPLPENGYIMWDIAGRADGTSEITIWWAEEEAGDG